LAVSVKLHSENEKPFTNLLWSNTGQNHLKTISNIPSNVKRGVLALIFYANNGVTAFTVNSIIGCKSYTLLGEYGRLNSNTVYGRSFYVELDGSGTLSVDASNTPWNYLSWGYGLMALMF
jgi:hypothetical protein